MPLELNRSILNKHKRLQGFLAFALKEGWHIKVSPKGNIQLKRKGYASIYNAGYLLEVLQYSAEQRIKYPLSIAGVGYE